MNCNIECPSCKQKYRVDESLLGEDVECAVCHSVFRASKMPPIRLEIPKDNNNDNQSNILKDQTSTVLHDNELKNASEQNAKPSEETKTSLEQITNNDVNSSHSDTVDIKANSLDNTPQIKIAKKENEKKEDEKKENKKKESDKDGCSWIYAFCVVFCFLVYVLICHVIPKLLLKTQYGHIVFFILAVIITIISIVSSIYNNKKKKKNKH